MPKRELVERALKAEEAAFAQTLDAGMQRLDDVPAAGAAARIDGEQLFQLHDTYGCPLDLIADILREKGMTLPARRWPDYEAPDGAAARTRARRRQVRRRHRVAGRADRATRSRPSSSATTRSTTTVCRSSRSLRDGRPVDAIERRRRGRGGPRPHAVLRRVRRPGRRHRRARRRPARASTCATRRSSPASSTATSARSQPAR